MNLFDVIPENERYLIDSYINEYAGVGSNRASLDHILRIWAQNKEKLYGFFGNQLQIKKKIEYKMPKETLMDNMRKLFANDSRFYSIYIKFRQWFQSEDIPLDAKENANLLREIFSARILADNYIDLFYCNGPIKIQAPSGKIIGIQDGAKPIKIISKIAKEFNILTDEEIEYIRIKHSQVLNQKTIKGTLVLSIHPLDYMTMSDNASGWSSCMSWQETGCYRRGTVEMMNSDNVVVAYIEGEQPMKIYTPEGVKEWNNKKWRQLFVVDEEIISSVKSYPYFNEEFTLSALEWLSDLLEANGGIDFCKHNFIFEECDVYDKNFSKEYSFNFYTNDMYNDFYTTIHYARISNPEATFYDVNYSGPRECMNCGDINCYFDDDDAPLLCCEECDESESCYECGCRNTPIYELDGACYCDECYSERARNEFLTNEIHDVEYMDNFIILPTTLRDSSELEIIKWIRDNDVFDVYMTPETSKDDKYFNSSKEIFNISVDNDDNFWYFTRHWKCFFADSLREKYREQIKTYDPYDV